MRSIDTTIGSTRKKLSHYTKIGPMVLWAYPRLETSKAMATTRIKMKGELTVKQSLKDTNVSEFIFFTRPREVMNARPESNSAEERVKKSVEKNPDRALNSMTFKFQNSDINIKSRKTWGQSSNKKPK